jgi:hypothetical protein
MRKRRIRRAPTGPVRTVQAKEKPKSKAPKKKRWTEIIARIPKYEKIVGVEIGIYKGITAEQVLKHRPDLEYHMVDPWNSETADQSYIDSGAEDAVLPQDEMEKNYIDVISKIMPYEDRVQIYRMKSVTAAGYFENRSVDFVFIDGDHSYDGCKRDIEAWYPKIKPGGWIGGHDYQHPRFPGVTQAVHERFSLSRIETGIDRTWFVKKRG